MSEEIEQVVGVGRNKFLISELEQVVGVGRNKFLISELEQVVGVGRNKFLISELEQVVGVGRNKFLISELEQVVGVGRNKFLIISRNNPSEYDQQDITTINGFFLWCKHPGPPNITITAFGMNVDWPNSVLTDKLADYYEDPTEIKYGAYKK